MYSPRIKEQIITTLHHIARSENRKLTDIVNEFLSEKIEQYINPNDFAAILRIINGTYVTLYLINGDDIGGIVQYVSDEGEVRLRENIIPLDPSLNGKTSSEVETWVNLIRRLSIDNENIDADSASPLTAALKTAAPK
jgi:hypothetical protein